MTDNLESINYTINYTIKVNSSTEFSIDYDESMMSPHIKLLSRKLLKIIFTNWIHV